MAAALARHDADVLLRDLAGVTRRTAWIVDDVWSRLRRRDRRGRPLRPVVEEVEPGVSLVDGRIVDDAGVAIDGNRLLRLARLAAERAATIDRATLRAARDADAAPLGRRGARGPRRAAPHRSGRGRRRRPRSISRT